MLILTRKVGESVQIGTNITVKVVAVEGGQVRLGFDAPSNVAIHREEVASKIKKQNEIASSSFDIEAIETFYIKQKK